MVGFTKHKCIGGKTFYQGQYKQWRQDVKVRGLLFNTPYDPMYAYEVHYVTRLYFFFQFWRIDYEATNLHLLYHNNYACWPIMDLFCIC